MKNYTSDLLAYHTAQSYKQMRIKTALTNYFPAIFTKKSFRRVL
jgi:hypothetical protein